MMEAIPNAQDIFTGTEIIVHMKDDQPLNVERFKAALKKHKVKLKGEPKKDAKKIL